MQYLEVSGAVRPIYWSLGVKRLRAPNPLFICIGPALKTDFELSQLYYTQMI